MVITRGLLVTYKHQITTENLKTPMMTFSVGIVANRTKRRLSLGMVLMLFVIIGMNPAIMPRYVKFRLLTKDRSLTTLKRQMLLIKVRKCMQ